MNKPDLDIVRAIMEKKAKIKQLYEELDLMLSEQFLKHGAGRFDYVLSEPINGQGFMKFVINDNIALLQSGKPVFKSTSMKPLTFETRTLKHRPKGLV